jgi:hypothetical protein
MMKNYWSKLLLVVSLVCISFYFSNCNRGIKTDVSNSLIYKKSTNAYFITEFRPNGVYKLYSSHMGGQFETFGTWNQDGKKLYIVVDSKLSLYQNRYYPEKIV